jgi:hypothetical protein
MRRLLEGHHNGVSIVHTGKLRMSRNSTAPKTGYYRQTASRPSRFSGKPAQGRSSRSDTVSLRLCPAVRSGSIGAWGFLTRANKPGHCRMKLRRARLQPCRQNMGLMRPLGPEVRFFLNCPGFTGCRRNSCFVSGHDFSQAVKSHSYEGFSCGYRGKNRCLSPRYPLSP